MFNWRKKYRQHPSGNRAGGKWRQVFPAQVSKAKRKIADRLGDWDSLLTPKERKWAVCLFLSAMCILSGWMLYDGLRQKSHGVPAYLERQSITQPENITLPDSLNIPLLEQRRRQQLKKQHNPDTILQHK